MQALPFQLASFPQAYVLGLRDFQKFLGISIWTEQRQNNDRREYDNEKAKLYFFVTKLKSNFIMILRNIKIPKEITFWR